VLAYAEGTHVTDVRWAGWSGQAAGSEPAELVVTIDADDDGVLEHSGCGNYFEIPATLGLTSNDGLLELETDATLTTRSGDLAWVGAQLPRTTLEDWNARLDPLLREGDADEYRLSLAVRPDAVSGFFYVRGRSASATCQVAAWPSDRVCRDGVKQLALSETVRGVAPLDLIANFEGLMTAEVPADGTTPSSELSVALESPGAAYCLHEDVSDASGGATDQVIVEVPLPAHLTTSDGSLDLWVSVNLSATLSATGEVLGSHIQSSGLALPQTTAAWGIAAPDVAGVKLVISEVRGSLEVSKFSPESTPFTSGDVTGSCLNAPYLGDLESVRELEW
jgi:hypothetical protein